MNDTALARVVKLVSVVMCAICLGWFVLTTIHWPLVNDAGLMHYIAFLMDKGFAPYRDIKDMNFPGGLLIEWGVMHLVGPGPISWRIYDLFLLALAFPATLIISWPNRFAGFLAAALFALFHGRDGVGQSGQRDLAVAVFLLTGYALTVLSNKGRHPLLYACASGIMLAAAATVKPTALLYILPIALVLLPYSHNSLNLTPRKLASFLAGMALPFAMIAGLLSYKVSFMAFLELSHDYLPFYANLGRQTPGQLFHEAFYGSLTTIAIVTGLLVFDRKRWRTPEALGLVAAVLCGYWSFYLQGKGFIYHRYPLVAFLLLLASMEVTRALHSPRRLLRAVGICGIIYLGLVLPPLYLRRASMARWQEAGMMNALTKDLASLADSRGFNLDHNVQCLDTISGCINTLYTMRLVQKTGFISDEFFFNPGLPPGLLRDRDEFRREVEARPPRVLVVTSTLFPSGPENYLKLDEWPALAGFIRSRYRIIDDRSFKAGMTGPSGYRIYLLND